jgi:hypothetical protein
MFIPSVQFFVKMMLRSSLHPKNEAAAALDSSTPIETLVAMEWTLLPPQAGNSIYYDIIASSTCFGRSVWHALSR